MSVALYPQSGDSDPNALLERKNYGDSAPTIYIPTEKCLAVMAYKEYFPDASHADQLQQLVSEAIMVASPGWCGSFAPDVDDYGSSSYDGGNYDMTQMFLLPLVYAYYDVLTPTAREKLINLLLARGRIRRAALDDTFTNGKAPNDWSRAGRVKLGGVLKVADIPETENHVLMIATARYLTNQLLYPRFLGQTIDFDNRRNGNADDSVPTCMEQVLYLLRNKLRDDFAEYNAKPYQEETRWALLNLFSYAYDAEVRLAAGMVLDYVSAHIAVSSCDLRRMVPFRRRNEEINWGADSADLGFMDVSLLDAHGADPMAAHFALHSGNTRAYQLPDNRMWPGDSTGARPWPWAIAPLGASNFFLEAFCDHRLAPSVHDLFVNDLHRRFFQRFHRKSMLDEPGGQRNCDNMEIYAGSPSYLISAGGRPAIWVIPGKMGHGYQDQNLGVAVPISFMPTGASPDPAVSTSDSGSLIQILQISATPAPENGIEYADQGATENYGVAPDFACGVGIHLPDWTGIPAGGDGLFFFDKPVPISAPLTLRAIFDLAGLPAIPAAESVRSLAKLYGFPASFSISALIDAVRKSGAGHPAGFYLAVHRWGDFVVLEAFDTWLHPDVSAEEFQETIKSNSPASAPVSGQEAVYTTFSGNRIHYVIWNNLEVDNHLRGSKILSIEYGNLDPMDTLVDAGNDTDPFLSGTILKSPRDGMVEIHNPSLGTTLTLDWSDPGQLVRISENGEVQHGAPGFEVWVDFDWTGPMEGDFYRPFSTLEGALNVVKDGGVIRIMAGSRQERVTIQKRVRLMAVGGGVALRAN
jgi:hypothetical protein